MKKIEFINVVSDMITFCKDNGFFDEELDYTMEDMVDFCSKMTEDIKKESDKPTEKGEVILKYIKENYSDNEFKSSDVASGLSLTSRAVTGSMLKLVNDKYVEKLTEKGVSPIIYKLTEKGKNYQFD